MPEFEKIILVASKESGWGNREIDLTGAENIEITTEFLPESGQERIVVTVIRTTSQSRMFSAFRNS